MAGEVESGDDARGSATEQSFGAEMQGFGEVQVGLGFKAHSRRAL